MERRSEQGLIYIHYIFPDLRHVNCAEYALYLRCIPGFIQCQQNGLCQFFRICRLNQQPIVIRHNDLRNAAYFCSYERLATAQALEHNGRVTFVQTWQYEYITSIHPHGDLIMQFTSRQLYMIL